MISFFKKELYASHILNKAKARKTYGTKHYKHMVEHKFPGAKRYVRLRALVSHAYKTTKKKYNTLSQLGKFL